MRTHSILALTYLLNLCLEDQQALGKDLEDTIVYINNQSQFTLSCQMTDTINPSAPDCLNASIKPITIPQNSSVSLTLPPDCKDDMLSVYCTTTNSPTFLVTTGTTITISNTISSPIKTHTP